MNKHEWQLIETAPLDKPILILYYKGGKNSRTRVCNQWVVTQATGAMLYKHVMWNGDVYYRTSSTSWVKGSDDGDPTEFVEWRDHLDRLIVNTASKVQKNIVKYWMPISYDGAFDAQSAREEVREGETP